MKLTPQQRKRLTEYISQAGLKPNQIVDDIDHILAEESMFGEAGGYGPFKSEKCCQECLRPNGYCYDTHCPCHSPKTENEECPNCGGAIAIRNPTGKCDHLYYPENVSPKPEKPKWTQEDANRAVSLCPNCGKKTYVESIFGSICSSCFYEPPKKARSGA